MTMATPKNNGKRGDLRLSLADLEAMRTHELADLLSNFVLLLRRLPDVPFGELGQTEQDQASNTGDDLVTRADERVNGHSQPTWWVGKD